MNKFSPDLLIYILIIGGIMLFNFLTQRAAARRRQEEAAAERAEQAEAPAPEEPLADIWGRTQAAPAAEPLPVPARVDAAPIVAAQVRRRRSGTRALLHGTQNLRHAMVVLTVLGPCRALDPAGGAAAGSSLSQAAQ